MNPLKRPVLGFLIRFALWYVFFLVPWTGLDKAYAVLYREASTTFFGKVGDHGEVVFRARPTAESGVEVMDTVIVVTNTRTRSRGEMPNNSRFSGYTPTTFLFALILATPLPWRRRFKALGLGFAAMSLFVGFRVWIGLMMIFGTNEALRTFTPGAFGQGALTFANDLFLESVSTGFLVGGFLWLLVTFRRGDWERIWAAAQPVESN